MRALKGGSGIPYVGSLTTYYILAFVISWAIWIPAVMAVQGLTFKEAPLTHVLLVLPGLGPAIAAGIALKRAGATGSLGARAQLRLKWKIPLHWYAFAIAVPPAILLIAGWGLDSSITKNLPHHPMEALPITDMSALAVYTALSLIAAPCEEIGWRGFALSRLQSRYFPMVATTIGSVLWALWHLPLFFVADGPIGMGGVPFGPWFAGVIMRSFMMTWLFNKSYGSVVITALFHVSVNVSGALLGVNSYVALAAAEAVGMLTLVLVDGPALGYDPAGERAT